MDIELINIAYGNIVSIFSSIPFFSAPIRPLYFSLDEVLHQLQ
jgi:regulator of extracellular matrix RemA (YlzA/DUF370 family)